MTKQGSIKIPTEKDNEISELGGKTKDTNFDGSFLIGL